MIKEIEKSKDCNTDVFRNNEKFIVFVIISQRIHKKFFTEFWNHIYKSSETSLEAKVKFIAGLCGGLGSLANFKSISKDIKIDFALISILLSQIFQNYLILCEKLNLPEVLKLIRFLITVIKIANEEMTFKAKPILENVLRQEKLYANAEFIRLMIDEGFFQEKIFIFLDFFDSLYLFMKSNGKAFSIKILIEEIINYFGMLSERNHILNSQFIKKKIIFFLKILYLLCSEKNLEFQSASLFSDEKNIDFDFSQKVMFFSIKSIFFLSSAQAIYFLSFQNIL